MRGQYGVQRVDLRQSQRVAVMRSQDAVDSRPTFSMKLSKAPSKACGPLRLVGFRAPVQSLIGGRQGASLQAELAIYPARK